jgi:hypothetical protein
VKLPRLRKPKGCDTPGCPHEAGHGPNVGFSTLPRDHRPAARSLRALVAMRVGPIWGCRCTDLKHASMMKND